MANAARAILIHNNKILVMRRNKQGKDYYTLIGGLVTDTEELHHGLIREVKEETGMNLTTAKLVFIEKHHDPYNDQYIFLCEASDYDSVGLEATSEEALMNKHGINIHEPMWIDINLFPRLPFLTSALQSAIVQGIKKGFPAQATQL